MGGVGGVARVESIAGEALVESIQREGWMDVLAGVVCLGRFRGVA